MEKRSFYNIGRLCLLWRKSSFNVLGISQYQITYTLLSEKRGYLTKSFLHKIVTVTIQYDRSSHINDIWLAVFEFESIFVVTFAIIHPCWLITDIQNMYIFTYIMVLFLLLLLCKYLILYCSFNKKNNNSNHNNNYISSCQLIEIIARITEFLLWLFEKYHQPIKTNDQSVSQECECECSFRRSYFYQFSQREQWEK